MPDHLLSISGIIYLLSTLALIFYMRRGSRTGLRLGRWLTAIGVAVNVGVLAAQFYGKGVLFPSSSYESSLFIAAVLGVVAVALSFSKKYLSVLLILLPLIVAGIWVFQWLDFSEERSLPTSWIWTHIVLMLVGEALFCFSAAISVVYLFAESQLRRRFVQGLFARIPSLPEFDNFIGEVVLAGFVLLSVGMFLGFVLAKEYWQSGWILDPKVIFCVLTWALYLALLLGRLLRSGVRGRKTAWISVVGFLSILFLSVGVEIFFPSQHYRVPRSSEEISDP